MVFVTRSYHEAADSVKYVEEIGKDEKEMGVLSPFSWALDGGTR